MHSDILELAAPGRLEFPDLDPRDEPSLPPLEIILAECADDDPSYDVPTFSIVRPSLQSSVLICLLMYAPTLFLLLWTAMRGSRKQSGGRFRATALISCRHADVSEHRFAPRA